MLNKRSEPDYWKGPAGVKGADKAPVFLDCLYVAINPSEDNAPLPREDAKPSSGHQMQYSCVNRHEGSVNCLFLDWSVRKVGLKELWTLKWHRSWDKDDRGNYDPGPWTMAGGVQPNRWPEWMREFKDY
jgi:prepilin-type processing-associated H-X9-DG protein